MYTQYKILIKIILAIVGININLFAQWTQYSSFSSLSINDVAISKNYVLVAPKNGGIYRSFGISNSWRSSNSGLPSTTLNVIKILVADGMIIVNGGDGIYRSLDEGDTWNKIFPNTPSINLSPIGYFNQNLFACNLTVIPGFPSLYRSTNFGITWNSCDYGIHSLSVHAITYFSGSLLCFNRWRCI